METICPGCLGPVPAGEKECPWCKRPVAGAISDAVKNAQGNNTQATWGMCLADFKMGEPVDQKCPKCGAIIDVVQSGSLTRCRLCGGIISGIVTECPNCGAPQVGSILNNAEQRLRGTYSELIVDLEAPYSILSIKSTDKKPPNENYLIEYTSDNKDEVIRPKPSQATIRLPIESRVIFEENIRHSLQNVDPKDLLMTMKNVGVEISSCFPDAFKTKLSSLIGGSMLLLALDDSVVGIPWELYFDGTEFLSTKVSMGRIVFTDAPIHVMKRKHRKGTNILLISNPDSGLPHTKEDGDRLQSFLEKLGSKTDHMFYNASTHLHTNKENILNAMRSGKYDIIHFVGHSFYDEKRPENSAFLVGDGDMITASDFSTVLDLSYTEGKEPPYLFFAHSCAAGAQRSWNMRTYESQVLGLSHAFIKHNIAYIGAFWNAYVKSSDFLAYAFFESLISSGSSIGQALTYAKRRLISEFGMSYPYCEWGNFHLYGDPSIKIKI